MVNGSRKKSTEVLKLYLHVLMVIALKGTNYACPVSCEYYMYKHVCNYNVHTHVHV